MAKTRSRRLLRPDSNSSPMIGETGIRLKPGLYTSIPRVTVSLMVQTESMLNAFLCPPRSQGNVDTGSEEHEQRILVPLRVTPWLGCGTTRLDHRQQGCGKDGPLFTQGQTTGFRVRLPHIARDCSDHQPLPRVLDPASRGSTSAGEAGRCTIMFGIAKM